MKQSNKSALKVNPGIEQPSSVNPDAIKAKRRNKQKPLTTDQYVDGILSGNIVVLSKAITLLESLKQEHNEQAREIVEKCLPHSGKSLRIGITGVPGAGKSTFIESFGKKVTENYKLAVLAIDPSSERTKGSILGDKTRMVELGSDHNAFIRPSPSAGSLGGVARKTREALVLCEAAGFNVIFIETVGVGQSEIAVHSMTDFFLLVMLAGAGDELQGIKRGIMEMANMLIINKADGNNINKAMSARAEYQGALRMFPPDGSGWEPRVLTCSAIEKTGLDEIMTEILDYVKTTKENGYFEERRKEQTKYRMYEMVDEELRKSFYENDKVKAMLADYEEEICESKITSYAAARKLLDLYFNL